MQQVDLIHIYCNIIITVVLVNTSITSHNYFFFGVRTFKIYSLSKFLICNTAVLNIVTMLYVRSLDLTYPAYLELCTLWPTSAHSVHSPASSNHHSTLCMSLIYLDSIHKWDHTEFVCLHLVYFTECNFLHVHPRFWKWQDFLLCKGWIMLHHIFFFHSPINGLVSFSHLRYCESCYNEHRSTDISLKYRFQIQWTPRSDFAGFYASSIVSVLRNSVVFSVMTI